LVVYFGLNVFRNLELSPAGRKNQTYT